MSLTIQTRRGRYVEQYWRTDTAYNDILNAVGGRQADQTLLTQHGIEARRILSDWVWASNYRTVRYVSGAIPCIRQLAFKRIYPDEVTAKRALAADIWAEAGWNQETQWAQQIMNTAAGPGAAVETSVHTITQAVHNYLSTRGNLRAQSKRNGGSYNSYYRWQGMLSAVALGVGGGLASRYFGADIGESILTGILGTASASYLSNYYIKYFTDGTYGVLDAMVNANDTDLITNLAVIHDIAELLQRLPGVTDGFTPFDKAYLLMTVWLGNRRQILPANQILEPGTGNQMRWTLANGRFPDNRTPNNDHPAVIYARMLDHPVQMGPSGTTAAMLNLARDALTAAGTLNIPQLLGDLALGLFAFWNQSYNRRCTMIHCYHFVTDCATRNFQVQRTHFNNRLGIPNNSAYYDF